MYTTLAYLWAVRPTHPFWVILSLCGGCLLVLLGLVALVHLLCIIWKQCTSSAPGDPKPVDPKAYAAFWNLGYIYGLQVPFYEYLESERKDCPALIPPDIGQCVAFWRAQKRYSTLLPIYVLIQRWMATFRANEPRDSECWRWADHVGGMVSFRIPPDETYVMLYLDKLVVGLRVRADEDWQRQMQTGTFSLSDPSEPRRLADESKCLARLARALVSDGPGIYQAWVHCVSESPLCAEVVVQYFSGELCIDTFCAHGHNGGSSFFSEYQAAYLGRELGRAEHALLTGMAYIQDAAP